MRSTPDAPLAVLGAGFSGSLLALHLARAGRDVLLVERGGAPGPGLAFGTADPLHLLNVPAQAMSALPEEPAHFLEWLRRQDPAGLGPLCPEAGPAAFVPRGLYGRYLAELLDAAPAGRITWIAAVAEEVIPLPGGGYELRLGRDRQPRRAAAVALCLGNPPPSRRGAPPHLFGDPWDPAALEGIGPEDPLLLVGTGLTMADLVMTLVEGRGHRGVIHAVSRHGWLPLAHASPLPKPVPAPELPRGAGPLALMRVLREAVRAAAARGEPWQAALDGFRPQLQAAWCTMPEAERACFLRHGRTLWNLHRHRIAPAAADRLEAAVARDQLRLLAGRLREWLPAGEGGEAVIATRGGGESRLGVARILFCTGADMGPDWLETPPLCGLRDRGLLRGDTLGLGLDVHPDRLQALGADGRPVAGLFVAGPATRSALWEATAVPELRVQAQRVAAEMAKA